MGPSKRFDYVPAGFVYDAAVLGAVSRYVQLQREQHPGVGGPGGRHALFGARPRRRRAPASLDRPTG